MTRNDGDPDVPAIEGSEAEAQPSVRQPDIDQLLRDDFATLFVPLLARSPQEHEAETNSTGQGHFAGEWPFPRSGSSVTNALISDDIQARGDSRGFSRRELSLNGNTVLGQGPMEDDDMEDNNFHDPTNITVGEFNIHAAPWPPYDDDVLGMNDDDDDEMDENNGDDQTNIIVGDFNIDVAPRPEQGDNRASEPFLTVDDSTGTDHRRIQDWSYLPGPADRTPTGREHRREPRSPSQELRYQAQRQARPAESHSAARRRQRDPSALMERLRGALAARNRLARLDARERQLQEIEERLNDPSFRAGPNFDPRMLGTVERVRRHYEEERRRHTTAPRFEELRSILDELRELREFRQLRELREEREAPREQLAAEADDRAARARFNASTEATRLLAEIAGQPPPRAAAAEANAQPESTVMTSPRALHASRAARGLAPLVLPPSSRNYEAEHPILPQGQQVRGPIQVRSPTTRRSPPVTRSMSRRASVLERTERELDGADGANSGRSPPLHSNGLGYNTRDQSADVAQAQAAGLSRAAAVPRQSGNPTVRRQRIRAAWRARWEGAVQPRPLAETLQYARDLSDTYTESINVAEERQYNSAEPEVRHVTLHDIAEAEEYVADMEEILGLNLTGVVAEEEEEEEEDGAVGAVGAVGEVRRGSPLLADLEGVSIVEGRPRWGAQPPLAVDPAPPAEDEDFWENVPRGTSTEARMRIAALSRETLSETGCNDAFTCAEIAVGTEVVRLPCGHRHAANTGILRWLTLNMTCPFCRHHIGDAFLLPVVDGEARPPVAAEPPGSGQAS